MKGFLVWVWVPTSDEVWTERSKCQWKKSLPKQLNPLWNYCLFWLKRKKYVIFFNLCSNTEELLKEKPSILTETKQIKGAQ